MRAPGRAGKLHARVDPRPTSTARDAPSSVADSPWGAVGAAGQAQQSYACVHMRGLSPFKTEQPFSRAGTIGEVGETGRAEGCHLLFELWTGPGWRTGEGQGG